MWTAFDFYPKWQNINRSSFNALLTPIIDYHMGKNQIIFLEFNMKKLHCKFVQICIILYWQETDYQTTNKQRHLVSTKQTTSSSTYSIHETRSKTPKTINNVVIPPNFFWFILSWQSLDLRREGVWKNTLIFRELSEAEVEAAPWGRRRLCCCCCWSSYCCLCCRHWWMLDQRTQKGTSKRGKEKWTLFHCNPKKIKKIFSNFFFEKGRKKEEGIFFRLCAPCITQVQGGSLPHLLIYYINCWTVEVQG